MILVLGGAQSGKTGFAEKMAAERALAAAGRVIYLATAQAMDDEMKLRIEKHRQNRPAHWITREEPFEVPRLIKELNTGQDNVILLDCLTLWLSNLLMKEAEKLHKEKAEKAVLAQVDALIAAAESCRGQVIIVSNLVETGLVAPSLLGRVFQEIAGKSHQRIAAQAAEVYQVTAGLAQCLKGAGT